MESIIENTTQKSFGQAAKRKSYQNVEEETREISQFVTFSLGEEEYGIEIMKVQEIIGYQGFTRIPNVPDFIKGVLNLRGTVVPVVDLRKKFSMEDKEYTKFTVIIILEALGRIMGIIVDAISDVVSLTEQDIQDPPSFNDTVRTDFIKGMGKKNDKLIILLDMDKVLSQEELEELDNIE
jgi:purine-binding chemotaxis protein CheW